jgi:hypothetical protein
MLSFLLDDLSRLALAVVKCQLGERLARIGQEREAVPYWVD